jgi:hypothetical protein
VAGVCGGVEEGGNGVLLRATGKEEKRVWVTIVAVVVGFGGGNEGNEGLCAEGLCAWVRSRQPMRVRHVVGVVRRNRAENIEMQS